MTHSTMTFRRYLVLGAVTLTSSCGDTFLSRGMKSLGPVSITHPLALIHAVFSPWVAAGIVLLIGFFASYMASLSWADLTYVLPASSLGYVIMTLLARFWLHEHVSTFRWLGVLFITAGVGFVTRGPSWTEHTTTEHPTDCAATHASQAMPRVDSECNPEAASERVEADEPIEEVRR